MSDTIHSCSPFCTLPTCFEGRERKAFEAWCARTKRSTSLDNTKKFYWCAETEVAWEGYQAATAHATALERERCAQVCETQQVATDPRKGKILMDWYDECGGMHEGMTYAKAIRQGGDT